MGDLISKRAAIDKINERQRKLIYCFGFENDMVKIMNISKSIISAIPPVQPEIIKCKECKHWEQESICDGYCSEIEKDGFDEDHFCGYAERREDE